MFVAAFKVEGRREGEGRSGGQSSTARCLFACSFTGLFARSILCLFCWLLSMNCVRVCTCVYVCLCVCTRFAFSVGLFRCVCVMVHRKGEKKETTTTTRTSRGPKRWSDENHKKNTRATGPIRYDLNSIRPRVFVCMLTPCFLVFLSCCFLSFFPFCLFACVYLVFLAARHRPKHPREIVPRLIEMFLGVEYL